MSVDDGGPAFPQPVIPGHTQVKRIEDGQVVSLAAGMSLADYFAAKALQGYLAGRNHPVAPGVDRDSRHDAVAKACYQYSDAMLAERQKRMEAKA